MWTLATRAQHSRKGLRYETDLTDKEWELIESFMSAACATGRPRAWPMREILNAIFYCLLGGVAWRLLLPKDFPPFGMVYGWSARLRDCFVFERINHALVMKGRERFGREASPTAAIEDSQTVKTCESGGPRGYDAGKRGQGPQSHALVGTDGRG